MNEIVELMEKRVDILRKAIERAKKNEGPYPEGRLRISIDGNSERYYHVASPGDNNGKYIKKQEHKLAEALARKDYNRCFLRDAELELSRLEQAIRNLSKSNADLSYLELSPPRRKMIDPYIIPDELYAARWQNKPVKTNPYMPEKLLYDTQRGEKVRSKSEAFIADILYSLQIPYFYEKSLNLGKGEVRYPDFTMLHVKKREEMYLEHLGLLEDEEYRAKNLQKLDEYRKNGIYLGKNLLITYETSQNPLDIKGIKQMLKATLL